MRKLIALVLTLILALTAVSAMAEGKLVVLTPNPDAEIQNILNPFIEKYGVEVELMSMGTGNCYTKLLAEVENPTVDVMFGGVESTWTHDYPNLFMTYVAAGNDKLVEAYQNPDGMITNYILGGSCVLIVNEELEAELGLNITSYADLLDPKLKGQIASADPNASSSAFAHLSNILLAMGDGECPYESEAAWNYVAKLIEQLDGAYTSGSSAVYKGVTNGEYVVGLTYEVGAVGYIANGAQGVRAVYPPEGVCWTPVGSAIVNGAKNVETAKLFMDWLISEECQKNMAQAEGSVLRGVRTDLFVANEFMPAFDTLNIKYEDSDYTSGNKQTILDHWNDLWNK